MAKVTIRLFGKLRRLAGTAELSYSVPGPLSAEELLRRLAEERGEQWRKLLLGDGEALLDNIIVLRNGRPVAERTKPSILDGDQVAVLLPVAGG